MGVDVYILLGYSYTCVCEPLYTLFDVIYCMPENQEEEEHTIKISDANWMHLKFKSVRDRKYVKVVLDEILTEYFSNQDNL